MLLGREGVQRPDEHLARLLRLLRISRELLHKTVEGVAQLRRLPPPTKLARLFSSPSICTGGFTWFLPIVAPRSIGWEYASPGW